MVEGQRQPEETFDLAGRIDQASGGGQVIERRVRGKLEKGLGASLGDVRIHDDIIDAAWKEGGPGGFAEAAYHGVGLAGAGIFEGMLGVASLLGELPDITGSSPEEDSIVPLIPEVLAAPPWGQDLEGVNEVLHGTANPYGEKYNFDGLPLGAR